jgi:hypothetical protein
MNKKIIFTDTIGVEEEYRPKPAFMYVPEWYKQMKSYISGKKEVFPNAELPQTIKKCMPVFDTITAGYIIPTYVDVYVRIENDAPYFSWAAYDAINFHSLEQLDKHPNANGFSAPKWRNPWGIKLPKGYSALFVPPMHNPNGFFKVLEGIVDCDTYTAPVNFPFLMNDTKFEGLIPAGTPMVQVIPFKRENWEMSIGQEEEHREMQKVILKLNHKFFDRYKTMFRTPKEYK